MSLVSVSGSVATDRILLRYRSRPTDPDLSSAVKFSIGDADSSVR